MIESWVSITFGYLGYLMSHANNSDESELKFEKFDFFEV